MSKACLCNNGAANTGVACTTIMAVQKKTFAIPFFDSTGLQNSIDLTDTFNDAYFTARVNDVPDKRWYPLPEMKNVTDERGDSLKETFEDGSEEFIQDGIRKFMALLVGGSPQLLGKLKTFRCLEFGLATFDKNGNLWASIGSVQDPCNIDLLYPIRVDKGSWDPTLVKTTDKTVQKIKVMFNFHIDEDDSYLRAITAQDISANLSILNGLLDVCSTNSAIDNTTFTVDLSTEYGPLLSPTPVTGLLVADFALYNITDSASVTIVSAVESVTIDGRYVVTFASQTNADVLRLTPTKSGYDFTNVVANTIQMPLT